MYEIIYTLIEQPLSNAQRISLVAAFLLSVVIFIFAVNSLHNGLKLSLAKFSCKTIADGEEISMNSFLSSFSWLSVVSAITLQTGFAKAVVYDRNKFKRPKQSTFLISCTGVLVYFAAGLVFFFFYVFLRQLRLFDVETATVPIAGAPVAVYVYQTVYSAIYYLSRICFNSVIVSIIPLLPFDMGDVLDMLLPEKASAFIKKHYPKFTAVLIAVAFLTVGKPDGLIENYSSAFMFWLYSLMT